MKKIVVLLLVCCLLAGGVLGFLLGKDGTIRATAPAVTPAAVPAAPEAETAASAGGIDYEALYALHEPDEIVMTVAGQDIPWCEYFYYLYRQCQSVEQYFDTMTMYGMAASWSDAADEDGHSYADLAVESARNIALSLSSTLGFAETNDVALSVADLETIEKKVQEDIVALCGEEGTRADLDKQLEELYLYQNGFTKLYGEDGAALSDEEALAYLEDNGYLYANHILFMTLDPASYEALDEETQAAKKAQAEETAAELQAIEDEAERLARFVELKAELDEDTGKALYPDGYVFLPGEMVEEFETAVKGQEAFQVSDPVESAYGYHVIMTLPLDPDAVLDYSSEGTPMSARSVAANAAYSAAVDAFTAEQEIIFAEGFEEPNLLDFVK